MCPALARPSQSSRIDKPGSSQLARHRLPTHPRSQMESLPLPSGYTAHYALFTLTNAAELRTRLVAASQLAADAEGDAERDRLDFSFIDASMVSGALNLLGAV